MPRYFDDLYTEETRDAGASTQRTQADQYRLVASEDVSRLAADIGRSYPWVTPGAALSLAKGGFAPDSAAAQLVAQKAGERKAQKGLGWHSIGDGFRSVARGAFTVLQSGAELTTAAIRDQIANAPSRLISGRNDPSTANAEPIYRQTQLGIIAEQLARGERVDTGSGYFGGGAVAAEQAQRARDAAPAIGGSALTLGRWTANLVTEPGTKPYSILSGLVDASVALGADPANALGAAGKARRAAKSLVDEVEPVGRLAQTDAAYGLVNGHRRAVVTNRADQWLTTGGGRRVVEYMAGEKDFMSMWRRFGGKIDAPLSARLVDADSADEVLAILRPELGITIRDAPTVDGRIRSANVAVRRRLEGVRLLGTMPGKHIDLEDVDGATNTLDRFLLNAKMDLDQRAALVEKMARSTDRIGRYNVVADSMEQVAKSIGGDPAAAKSMTRMFNNYNERLSAYFLDEVGDNAAILGATVDGNNFALPVPHLFNEYILRALPLPDARDIRVATSRIRGIRENAGVDAGISALDWLSQDVWKPMILLRGAWTVRVIGEEQVRMAASGINSVVNHPLSAIAWAMGRRQRLGIRRRGASDITGQLFEDGAAAAGDLDEFAQSLSRRGGEWADRVVTVGRGPVRSDEPQFVRSWADELGQLNGDPVAKRVAGGWSPGDSVPGGLTGNHTVDAQRWFWDGAGRTFREQMGQAHGRGALLTDRRVADEYVASIQRRIEIKTNGNLELLDAVATGRLNGAPIRTPELRSSQEFTDRLGALVAQGDAPQVVKGEIRVSTRSGASGPFLDMKDKVVESIFSTLMGRPTNWLSRSPSFRQFYWQRAAELLPRMTREAQEATVSAARDANLEGKVLRRMEGRMKVAGELSLDDADLVAKGYGLDKTRELLYDLSERGQLFDITRIIFPFGEAWKEVGTRWAQIGTENPQTIRRLQQGVEGARGSGFFHENERGEEVFSYPGSSFVTRALTGVPVPLTGSVAGLNMFSTSPLMPGVGPVVQVAAGKILPDRPEWEWARDLLLPFGPIDPEKRGGLLETFMPAWFQKWRQAYGGPTDERLFANTVMDVARYLQSTGKYDLSTEEGQRELEDASRRKAKVIYTIRGAAQFFAPSAPTPEWLVQDKDGRALVAVKLVELFREMQDADYDSALDNFMATFGDNLSLLIQPKSEGSSPTNSAAATWVRRNGAVVRDYPEVYGYFAPKGGEFDFDAYNRSFGTGERRALTPAEAIDRANDRIAGAIYSQARAKFGASPGADQRAVLRQLQDALIREYPGYEPAPRDMGAVDRMVRQLENAANDPKLAKTEVGQALTDYFAGRALADARAQELGLAGAAKGKAARPLRDVLRTLAAAITREHPDFAEVWDSVLSRELANDAEEK